MLIMLLSCTSPPTPDANTDDDVVGTVDSTSDSVAPPTPTEPPVDTTNVLLITLDDVSPRHVSLYGEGPAVASTPRLEQLAEQGMRFDRAWAMPACSPTRAALQTGRFPSRTGVGHAIDFGGSLQPEEQTLAEMLGDSKRSWSSSYVGKWHLTSLTTGLGEG